jgi:hypothetical protein
LADLRLYLFFSYRRVHLADDTAHLFLTCTSKEAQDVLWLLNLFIFPQLTSRVSLQRCVYLAFYLLHEQIPSLLGKQRKHFACGYCPFLFNFLSTLCSVIKMAVGRRSKLNCSRNVYLNVWRWEYFSTPCWCSVRTTPKVLLFGCWSITLFVYGIWIESCSFFHQSHDWYTSTVAK